MHILPIAKTISMPKLAKASKKPYITPKIEVIDMPGTPKLLATGRYYPEGAKQFYTEPQCEIIKLDGTPRIITTKPIA